MREIKFRALDEGKKKMIYPVYQNGDGLEKKHLLIYSDSWGICDSNAKPTKKRPLLYELILTGNQGDGFLMQFTGLKDKNGKEIYEGDIVKADSSYHIWGGAKLKVFYGEVKFEPERGYYCVFKDTNRTDIDKNHIEVIGNIYQNPELSCSNKG